MSERSLVTIYQELLRGQGFAATVDADGLVWLCDGGRDYGLVPAEDARRLLQLIWRIEHAPANEAELRSRAARLLAVSERLPGTKAVLEQGRLMLRSDQFVVDPAYLPLLFRTALAALRETAVLLSDRPDRPTADPAERPTADPADGRPEFQGGQTRDIDAQVLRRLARQVLPELGCQAVVDAHGAVQFRRRGGPYRLTNDAARPQIIVLSCTVKRAGRTNDRQRDTQICLEINRQKACVRVLPRPAALTAQVELLVPHHTMLAEVLRFGLQTLEEADALLHTLFGAVQNGGR